MKRQNPLQKALRKIEVEGRRQCFLLYSATALALHRHWGKGQEAIRRLFEMTHVVWQACANDHDHSMIQMCEQETGIEIQNGNGVSWRDVAYLNGQDIGQLSYAQILYMRQQQLKWVRPQIMACMMVSLHRKYGFGFERCSRIYQQIEEIEREYGCNPDRIRKACFDETKIDVAYTVTVQEAAG